MFVGVWCARPRLLEGMHRKGQHAEGACAALMKRFSRKTAIVDGKRTGDRGVVVRQRPGDVGRRAAQEQQRRLLPQHLRKLLHRVNKRSGHFVETASLP